MGSQGLVCSSLLPNRYNRALGDIQRIISKSNKAAQWAFSLCYPPPQIINRTHDLPCCGIPSSCGSHGDLAKTTGCLHVPFGCRHGI